MKIGRRALALALSLALLCSCAPMEPGTQESEPMRVVRVLTLLVPNTPVSYTHLDVYKRQCISSPATPPRRAA